MDVLGALFISKGLVVLVRVDLTVMEQKPFGYQGSFDPKITSEIAGHLQSGDDLSAVLRMHIHCEALLNNILSQKFSISKLDKMMFFCKYTRAHELGYIDYQLFESLKGLNDLRNDFCHEVSVYRLTKANDDELPPLLPDSAYQSYLLGVEAWKYYEISKHPGYHTRMFMMALWGELMSISVQIEIAIRRKLTEPTQ